MKIQKTQKYYTVHGIVVKSTKEIGQPEWRFTKYLKNQTGNIKNIEKVFRIA